MLRRILKLYPDRVGESTIVQQYLLWLWLGKGGWRRTRGLLAIFGLGDLEISFSFTFWDALIW